MPISVTNKVAATLTITTKDGVIHYVRPKVRDLRLNIEEEDVVDSSPQLVIKKSK